METGAALLKAVLASPNDDLPRLVYADWLDENGQRERAEHIRAAVHFGGTDYTFVPWFRKVGGAYWGVGERGNRTLTKKGTTRLLTAEFGGLLATTTCPYVRDLVDQPGEIAPGGVFTLAFRRGFLEGVRLPLADWVGGECGNCGGDGGSWSRSIDAEGNQVRLTCPACHCTGRTPGIGPAVVAAHPVQEVTLTDRVPQSDRRGFWWNTGHDGHPSASALPYDLWEQLAWDNGRVLVSHLYPTRELALKALSDAAILEAKSQPTCAR